MQLLISIEVIYFERLRKIKQDDEFLFNSEILNKDIRYICIFI